MFYSTIFSLDSFCQTTTMNIGDTLNYIFFTNPIATATSSSITKSVQALSTGLNSFLPKQNAPQIIKMDPEPLWKLASSSSYFVKIAGISGASAVILGAYGAHSLLSDDEKDDNVKKAFESANRYHFIHTLALLGVPLCRYPSLSGCLFILGLSMFCGTCYYSSLSGDHRFRRLTPIGGTFFILGWLSLFL
uniref:Putative small membrane protein n=1 Tax=Rhodnius prolixus TaxID=13249 RepID=R4FPR1_RHOPR